MKKAEEYLKGCEHDGSYIPVNEVLNLLKLAQEDAIREAVKECAENVETYEYPYMDSCPSCGHTATYVDMGSILSVADKLIKEL